MERGSTLSLIAQKLLSPRKGILAADQSVATIDKQIATLGITPSPELRRLYRQLLFTTPGIERFVTGVIMHDSTIRNHTDDKTPFVDVLVSKGIVPIIKVDKGTVPLGGFPGEVITEGLDGLADRFAEYYTMGARAAKWRAVITIGEGIPTLECIRGNATMLARYARLAQDAGIVPIIEPEVIYSGSHDLVRAEEVTTLVLKVVFSMLSQYRVDVSGIILKSSMVLAGSSYEPQSTPREVAEATMRTFKNAVPHEVPGIVFLSGGQTPEQATANLNAIGKLEQESKNLPWEFAFSFSRGLEQPVQHAWLGKPENVAKAQQVLLEVLERNCKADVGEL